MATRSKHYAEAFIEGEEAVRRKPVYAPDNPYDGDYGDDDVKRDLHEGWEDGAISAGLCEIYTNGVLDKDQR